MADIFTRLKRAEIMRAVKSRHTRPEMVVRRLVHGLGFRYSLHSRSLPGSPDLALVSRRKAIFVHGCYWHRHACPNGQSTPASRQAYWTAKFERNVARDRRARRRLQRLGWRTLTVWECQTRVGWRPQLAARLARFLAE